MTAVVLMRAAYFMLGVLAVSMYMLGYERRRAHLEREDERILRLRMSWRRALVWPVSEHQL
jgi:hypothetical protein